MIDLLRKLFIYGGWYAEALCVMVDIQDNVTTTFNYSKHILQDTSVINDSCTPSTHAVESIDCMIGRCPFLTSTDYTRRNDCGEIFHNEIALMLYGMLHDERNTLPPFMHPPSVTEKKYRN